MILHHGLFCNLPCLEGLKAGGHAARFLDSIHCRGYWKLCGGGLSSFCIKLGWGVVAARKLVITLGGAGMLMLIPTVVVASLPAIVTCFAIATFSYAAWSTMVLTLPADLYPPESVASVSSISGAAAGIGTIISTFLIGWVTDRYSFAPVVLTASLVPLVATLLVFVLIQRSRKEPSD